MKETRKTVEEQLAEHSARLYRIELELGIVPTEPEPLPPVEVEE